MNNRNGERLNALVYEMTDKPQHSFAAHYDARRASFFWGSEFIGHVLARFGDDGRSLRLRLRNDEVVDGPEEEVIAQMVDAYLADGMRYV